LVTNGVEEAAEQRRGLWRGREDGVERVMIVEEDPGRA
jgi:hypothetical protein